MPAHLDLPLGRRQVQREGRIARGESVGSQPSHPLSEIGEMIFEFAHLAIGLSGLNLIDRTIE